jgi:hypothetical protein
VADVPHYTARQFIDAIPGTGGIITAIARKVGCAWHTAKKYIDTYATIQAAYQDECESILDLAEAKVISAMKNDDGQMIRYYLSTKGKRRGYSERHETSGPDGGPIGLAFDPDAWKRQREEWRRKLNDVDDDDVAEGTPTDS